MHPTTKVRRWAEYLRAIRAFLDSRGYVEVSTEALVPVGAFEGSIDVLQVSYSGGRGELHTSPEIEMKRILAQTGLSIYQICKCFRDDPPTGVHLREFTMLEFYRVQAGYREIISEVKNLMTQLADRALDFEEVSMNDLVLKATGIDLKVASTAERLRAEITQRNLLNLSRDDDWEDMFFKLLIERVEPNLPSSRPTIVRDYPLALGALAGPHPDGQSVERFEVYWQGMELCNGCTELADVPDLKRRFGREQQNRHRQGKPPHAYPERLEAAMSSGFPPCAGVAIGLDRLFWCLHGRN